jgi:hypothetical protein
MMLAMRMLFVRAKTDMKAKAPQVGRKKTTASGSTPRAAVGERVARRGVPYVDCDANAKNP